jgi:hypothetical protein
VPQFLKLAGSSALMLWWVLSVLLRHSLILVSYLCVHSLLSSFCLTWKFC